MGKLALIALIVVALIFWLRFKATARERHPGPPAGSDADFAAMVRCAQCGVHLPGADASTGASGKVYCDPSHRTLARDDPA